jgi:hypothetical protein
MKTCQCSLLRAVFRSCPARVLYLAAAWVMAGVLPASAQRCITLQCPSNLLVECREPTGTRVPFAVTATNHCSSNLFVSCVPPSGSVFPPGQRQVICTATDGRSETNLCTFTVTVRDTTSPTLQCPPRILVPCQTPAGATVYFTVVATDNCDTNVTVTCTPASGTTFPIGTNIVQCTARDSSGNVGTCSFPVIVRGGCTSNACVSIVCPSNKVTQCESAVGTRVLFSVTATNRCLPGDVRITCEPPSGSLFGMGITTVMCRASDSRGNEDVCTFTVEVEDEIPPVIQCPSNMVVNAQGPDGAIATWSISATDNCSTDVTIRCRPPSGSVFPIGTTAVSCVAVDESGNVSVCGFGVTVRPRPFEIFHNVTRAESNVTLHWFGNGVPQEALSLSPPVNWRTLTLPIVQNGEERSMVYPNPTGIRFFRLMASPLAPPPDSDRDGVPDAIDRCPGTPPGLAVDACGCANIELARRPQVLTKGLTENLQSAIAGLQSNPGMVDLSEFGERLSQDLITLEGALQQMRAGELIAGGDVFRRGLSSLEAEHLSLEMLIADRQRMPMPRPEGFGDVTDEDVQLIRLRVLAGILQDAIDSGHAADVAFERSRRAITGQSVVRGEIVEINDAEHWLRLDTGKVIGLAERFYADDEIHEGGLVAISSLDLDDGTGIALDMTDVATGSGFPSGVAQVQYLHLRVAPAAQRFPPASYGPYTLHHPDAYEYDGVLWLEEGARLGVTSSGFPTLVSNGVVKYTMKLDVKYISVEGYYKDATLAHALTPSGTPVTLPSDIYPNTLVVVWATVRRQVCPSVGACSRLEIYSVESYIIRVRPRFSYATALYSTTLFDLEDSPNETGFRPANIYSVAKYSVLFDVPNVSFAAEGYGAPGNGSTYPVVVPISLGQNFTVAAPEYDFYKPDELFNFDYTGVTNFTALRWPRATGKHNGRSFAYSVAHLKLIRDVVTFCNELPHTFYRLPFAGGWPVWKMGQANNNPAPFATHCPTCYNAFAFDFVADQGTEILAARGGVVIDLDESQTGNCWNSALSPPRCNDPCNSAPNFILIRHQDGTIGVYYHMPQNGVYVSKGQHVRRGDSIAVVGNTGCSSNSHLHFQVDPMLGASQSTLVRFEARGVCSIASVYYPCGSNQECYTPSQGDILFSTNHQ